MTQPLSRIELRLHAKQGVALETMATEVLYGGAVGGGKALAVDTPIATPFGWSAMGEISIGDTVFDERGQPCRVVAATPIMTGRPCYRVRFSDGAEIVADANHQWLTFDVAERSAALRLTSEWRERRRAKRGSRAKEFSQKPWVSHTVTLLNQQRQHEYKDLPTGNIRTTEEIARTLRYGAHGRGINHSVDVSGPLDCAVAALPIDPYVLGAWLGDGDSSQAAITSADTEIVEAIAACGYNIRKRTETYAYGIPGGMLTHLRTLSLINNKHIPNIYLRASQEQRLALLQGLMDTDGHANDRGQCEFCVTRRQLVDDVAELVSSLGIKCAITESHATLNGRHISPKYTIKFMTEKPAFRMARKLIRQKRGGFRGTHSRRYIEACDPIESVPVRCIEVDSPSHLFLAGRQMIPTHNSHLMRAAAIMWCGMIPGLQVYLFRRLRDDLVKNHIEGPSGFRALLAPWVRDGLCEMVEDEIRFWNGAKIYLCHCKDEKDRFKYLGSEIHVLCCEENERALLADGTLRRVSDLRAGDLMQTLQGARAVTWVGERKRKACVRARVSVGAGSIFEQIHSETHKVLTPAGWLSYADICQVPLSAASQSTQSHFAHKCSEPISKPRPSGMRLPGSQSPDSLLPLGYDRSLWDRPDEKASAAHTALAIRGTDYGSSECDNLGVRQLSSGFSFPVVLHAHSRGQGEAVSPLSSLHDEVPYALSACTPLDSLGDYRPYSCLYGGYQHHPEDTHRGAAHRQGDVEAHNPKSLPSGGPGIALGYNPCKSLRYAHPYTGEQRTAEEPVRLGTCVLEPCEERWTVDITVDGENHYITYGGLVNQNCVDELTTFTDKIYRFLRSRVRMAGITLPPEFEGKFPRILCSSNPGNVGHHFVKAAFIDPRPMMEIERMAPSEGGMLRQFIPARLNDNPSVDPTDYGNKVEGLGSPELVRAMKDGDWNVVAGAFFPEFSTDLHVIAPRPLPRYWQRYRSFDWGSARPFSVGWYAVSDGELPDLPRGALIRYREWYGAARDKQGLVVPNTGLRLTAEEVADGIVEREKDDAYGNRLMGGVADPSIFAENGGPSIATRMAGRKCSFRAADNTRVGGLGAVSGWDHVRSRLKGDGEVPTLFFFSTCTEAIRTFPALQHDDGRPEDIDTDAEDHVADEIRYACAARPYTAPLPPSADAPEPDRYARTWRPRRAKGSSMAA